MYYFGLYKVPVGKYANHQYYWTCCNINVIMQWVDSVEDQH